MLIEIEILGSDIGAIEDWFWRGREMSEVDGFIDWMC
jgi:hypothetical protein